MTDKKEPIQELINKDINDLLSFKDIPAIDVTEMVKFNGESHSLIMQVTQAVVQEIDSQSKCDALNMGLSKVNKKSTSCRSISISLSGFVVFCRSQ